MMLKIKIIHENAAMHNLSKRETTEFLIAMDCHRLPMIAFITISLFALELILILLSLSLQKFRQRE